MLVKLCDSCKTALSVCFYQPSGLNYDRSNVWVIYAHELGSLTNCEKTVRCDADLRSGACEAL